MSYVQETREREREGGGRDVKRESGGGERGERESN